MYLHIVFVFRCVCFHIFADFSDVFLCICVYLAADGSRGEGADGWDRAAYGV